MRINPFVKSIPNRSSPIVSKNSPYYNGKIRTETSLYKILENKKEIVFGPMLMEMGWEIMIWSGFIKRYKFENPDKKIIVLTRKSRVDLYNTKVDEIYSFEIEGDYTKYSPRTNDYKFLSNDDFRYKNFNKEILTVDIVSDLKQKYPDAFFYDFSDIKYTPNPPVNLKKGHYDFYPSEENAKEINKILINNLNKKVIFIFSRHRRDLTDRNWSEENWLALYEMFSKLSNCLFFISGVSPSFVKPDKKYDNIIVLEDMVMENPSTNVLGLSIEVLKKSNYAFGLQSAGLFLARLMKVPSIYIGYDNRDMATKDFNPFDTESVPINPDKIGINSTFCVSVNKVYDRFFKFITNERFSKLSYEIEKSPDIPNINIPFNIYPDNTRIEFNYIYDQISSIRAIKKNVAVKNPLYVYAPPGIGDSLFSLQYAISNTNRQIFLKTWKRPGFASLFLLGLKNVVAVEEFNSNDNHYFLDYQSYVRYVRSVEEEYLKLENFDEIKDFYSEVNTYLENGKRLETVFPNLKCNYNLDWEITEEDKKIVEKIIDNKKIILIYSSSYKNNGPSAQTRKHLGFSNWSPDSWVELVEKLLSNIDNNTKIIWVGAKYDFDLSKYVMSKLVSERKSEIMHLQDLPSGIFIPLLKKSKCFISFQSGLSCISLVEQIPTAMFWFDHLHSMKYSFCHPNMINNEKKYYCSNFNNVDMDILLNWVKYNLN